MKHIISAESFYEFLTFAGGHPNGKKAGKLRIPELAKRGHETMLGLVSGLFSVEGSVKIESNVRLAMEMLEPELIQELHGELRVLGFKPHAYGYVKDEKVMFGLYVYGLKECFKFLEDVGLFGKRREKLSRFLRSNGLAVPSPRQPGGGSFRRL